MKANDVCECKDNSCFVWHLDACNEAGWTCLECGRKAPGETPGCRPDLDIQEIEEKVSAVLQALHESELIYVSNGSEGDHVASMVARRCRETGTYSQAWIAHMILDRKARGKP